MALAKMIIPTVSPEYAERLNRRSSSAHQEIWTLLDSVCDPELPTVTIWDLGILHDITWTLDGWLIEITLTYSGCPAVGVIKEDIQSAFKQSKITEPLTIKVILAPAWTTDFISPAGKQQLKSINIAPPEDGDEKLHCPLCDSQNTEVISEFGSTSCKALYRCKDCLEPFDYFKPF
jgi:ring-1,2-phenylacetyl-CoA epoxidase subunit PaaD